MKPHVGHTSIRLRRPRVHSSRGRVIARWFGLELESSSVLNQSMSAEGLAGLIPQRGQILLITGPSGSGKSTLLRELSRTMQRRDRIDLGELKCPDRAVVDCFGAMPLASVLELLSRVGLAEAWTYLRKPDELSEGQRWRLRLAIGLERMRRRRGAVLISDEFGATLDRVTAAVVARAMRKIITSSAGGAIVATSADDLAPALRPDRQAVCDFESIRIDGPCRAA